MKKVAILYCSIHHQNTEQLLKGLSKDENITLINLLIEKEYDLDSFDIVGLASGIYHGQMHKKLYDVIDSELDIKKHSVFLIYTSGTKNDNYANSLIRRIKNKGIPYLGEFNCKGWDTFGFWKYIGGISKKHPNSSDIESINQFISVNIIK